ncbi:hypothetical protein I8752_21060 [Nostocaceae cyanobacterium CENA369]|uniref:Uncharacterized protein n=5 Tax=Dendronalium TaxID=2840442 RepID=A0A8J7I7N9_9NOST|nr:hypothetical protein [Dendronalium phyllosphericum CENA369]
MLFKLGYLEIFYFLLTLDERCLCPLHEMPTNLKDSLDVILSVSALVGIIFHIAKTKADIEKSIDDVKDQLTEELRNLRTDIKVSDARYQGKKEMIEYFINDLYRLIHHRSYRFSHEIKDLQSYLTKDGFIARSHYGEEPPPPKKVKIEEI